MEEKEKLYYYYLCKNKRYLFNNIRKIDGEYFIKIESTNLGIIAYTSNYGYKFNRTIEDGEFLYIFIERFELDEKTKNELKSLEPLKDKEGFSYTYTDKNLNLIVGEYPSVSDRYEIMKIRMDKYRKYLNESQNYKIKENINGNC